MSCRCHASNPAQLAVASLGDLSDWFPPAILFRDVKEWIENQRAAAGAQGAVGAAQSIGPYLLGGAIVFAGAAVAIAMMKGGR